MNTIKIITNLSFIFNVNKRSLKYKWIKNLILCSFFNNFQNLKIFLIK